MAAGPGFGMILLMMVLQGSANDLLDFVDSPSYWKAQQVEMTVDALAPSVKGAPAGAENAPKTADVRRLMAIRSLGELKKKEALPLLKPLVNDKSPFVADYANQAIATIEGAAYHRAPTDRKKLAEDVDLLPVGCGVVAQTTFPGGGAVSYEKMFGQMKGMMGMGPRPGANDPEEMDRRMDEARRQITDSLIELTGKLGNLRLDAVTFGLSGDVGNEAGFAVLFGRGTYDAVAARETLKAQPQTNTDTVNGFEVFTLPGGRGGSGTVVCPSNDRFLLFAGPNTEALPLQEVLAAVKNGKRDAALDADMTQLLASVDRSKRLWAVMRMTDAYRNAKVLAPFDSMTLTEEDHADETLFTLIARGKNPDQIAASVDDFEAGRQNTLEAMRNFPAQLMPANIADFLESVNVRNDGLLVTATASFKGSSSTILQTLPMMLFGMRMQGRGGLRRCSRPIRRNPPRSPNRPQLISRALKCCHPERSEGSGHDKGKNPQGGKSPFSAKSSIH